MVNTYRGNDDIDVYSQQSGNEIIGGIMVDEVEQIIPNNIDYFDSVSIQFATYARSNNADYKFMVFENNNLLYEQLFNAKKMEDAKYFTFTFDGIKVNHDNKYSFRIKPVYATSDDCISIFANKNTNEFNYKLSVNNKIDWFKTIFTLIFILIFFIINYFINSRNIKPENIYLIFSVYTLAMLFLIPPLNTPDEWTHFGRSYKLSQYIEHVGDNDYLVNNKYYGPSLGCLSYGNPEVTNEVSNREDIRTCLFSGENDYQDGYNFNKLYYLNPIGHIIPSIGIKIADFITNSPLVIFFFGRLLNFIVSFLIIHYSIKKSKENKIILLLVATIPMLLQQMISYSYDSLLNSFMIFYIYLIMKHMSSCKMSVLDYVLFFLSFLFVLNIKYIYLLLLLPLIYIVKKGKLKINLKTDLIYALKVILPCIIAIVLSYILHKLWINFSVYLNSLTGLVSSSSDASNMSLIISNPSMIFSLALNTLSVYGWFYIKSLFGYFGWFAFSFDDYIYYIYFVLIFITIMSRKLSTNLFTSIQRIFNIIIVFALVSFVFGAMYISWSSYGLDYIDGVQGRYFLPILPLLLISIVPKNKQIFSQFDEKDIFTSINFILLLTIIVILSNVY